MPRLEVVTLYEGLDIGGFSHCHDLLQKSLQQCNGILARMSTAQLCSNCHQ